MSKISNASKQPEEMQDKEFAKESVADTKVEEVKDKNEEEVFEKDESYLDSNYIVINLVKNTSLYRKANDRVLPKRRDFIGSSINSSRILSSNKEEMAAYLPGILGVSENDPSFMTRVKQYFNNIKIGVDELGKKFDISFMYNKKSYYTKVQKEIDKVEAKYLAANKSTLTNLKKALNEKIKELNIIEGEKYKYGYPVNVDDYLMYRHCLLYPDIAKDISLINADPNIRFYIKDEKREADRLRKQRNELNKAKSNYISLLNDDSLFDAMYVQYCVHNNLPIISSMLDSRVDKEIKLDRFSVEEPSRFNKLFSNKDLKLMSSIELLISRGELIRLSHNQNITTVDGQFIGANIGEAVAWFKNLNNASVVNTYMNRLKNI